MTLLVRAFPLVKSEADLKDSIAELTGPQRAAALAFYAAHGVTHESWYLQQLGPYKLVIALTQVEDVDASAQKFAEAAEGFAAWFKREILELSGVDPSETPRGPDSVLVYEWSQDQQVARMFAPPLGQLKP